MQEKRIDEIASVTAGYAFRGAVKPQKDGAFYVLQAKDLVQGQPFISTNSLIKISQNPSGYNGYLRKGDVLLISRGTKGSVFRSTVFESDAANVIPSSSVHSIRITAKDVLPEYVSYYLNSREGQGAIAKIISGSYVGAVPRKKLGEITVPMPNLSKQTAMVNLCKNIQEQQKITVRQNKVKQGIIGASFTNLLKH